MSLRWKTFPRCGTLNRTPAACGHGSRSQAGLRTRQRSHHHLLQNALHPEAKYEIVKTMRASSLVLGPWWPAPAWLVWPCRALRYRGRPIDMHIRGLEKMGATIVQEHGYLEARAERLRGAHLVFDKITVTGTEDLLMAAVLAEGETLMENCAREPEVSDLAALLSSWAPRSKAREPQPSAFKAFPVSMERAIASIPIALRLGLFWWRAPSPRRPDCLQLQPNPLARRHQQA